MAVSIHVAGAELQAQATEVASTCARDSSASVVVKERLPTACRSQKQRRVDDVVPQLLYLPIFGRKVGPPRQLTLQTPADLLLCLAHAHVQLR